MTIWMRKSRSFLLVSNIYFIFFSLFTYLFGWSISPQRRCFPCTLTYILSLHEPSCRGDLFLFTKKGGHQFHPSIHPSISKVHTRMVDVTYVLRPWPTRCTAKTGLHKHNPPRKTASWGRKMDQDYKFLVWYRYGASIEARNIASLAVLYRDMGFCLCDLLYLDRESAFWERVVKVLHSSECVFFWCLTSIVCVYCASLVGNDG